MHTIQYHRISPDDKALLEQVAEWYFNEWKKEPSKTITRISNFPTHGFPFHLLMTVDETPVATGGLDNETSIVIDKPHLKKYQPWLSQVYTTPENQNKGYGTMLCHEIEERAKALGVKEYYLFTYTAEKLYLKLGWQVMERFEARGKNMVVMKKELY